MAGRIAEPRAVVELASRRLDEGVGFATGRFDELARVFRGLAHRRMHDFVECSQRVVQFGHACKLVRAHDIGIEGEHFRLCFQPNNH